MLTGSPSVKELDWSETFVPTKCNPYRGVTVLGCSFVLEDLVVAPLAHNPYRLVTTLKGHVSVATPTRINHLSVLLAVSINVSDSAGNSNNDRSCVRHRFRLAFPPELSSRHPLPCKTRK